MTWFQLYTEYKNKDMRRLRKTHYFLVTLPKLRWYPVDTSGEGHSNRKRSRIYQGLVPRMRPKEQALREQKTQCKEKQSVCRGGNHVRPTVSVSGPRKNLFWGPGQQGEGGSDQTATSVSLDGKELLPGTKIQGSSWEMRNLVVSQWEIPYEGPKFSRFPSPEFVPPHPL